MKFPDQRSQRVWEGVMTDLRRVIYLHADEDGRFRGLAEAAHLHETTLVNLVSGKTISPSFSTIMKIAAAVGNDERLVSAVLACLRKEHGLRRVA